MGVLPDPTQGDRPLAAAAHFFLGNTGAAFITAGALVAICGYEASMMLNVPRLTFALAERGDFPPIFAAIHRKFRTPYISIVVFAVLVWALALWGSFQWNAILSAVARLLYYAVVCAALPALRRRQPGEALFRLPLGPGFAVFGVGLCLVLITAPGCGCASGGAQLALGDRSAPGFGLNFSVCWWCQALGYAILYHNCEHPSWMTVLVRAK
jgi:amino acid transporter